MKRFVYNVRYAKLLISMIDRMVQIDELAREHNSNAGHLRIVLDQWHKEGIIHKDKPGRDYQIKLTNKGAAICIKLAGLIEIDENWEEKQYTTEPTREKENESTTTKPSSTVQNRSKKANNNL